MTRQSQADRILARLREGPATSWELQQLGICSHTRRIFELRKHYDIVMTERWQGKKRICSYELRGQQELFGSAA